MENNLPVSNCCGAMLVTVSSDEGTSYYTCAQCHKPCDIKDISDKECTCHNVLPEDCFCYVTENGCVCRGCGGHKPCQPTPPVVSGDKECSCACHNPEGEGENCEHCMPWLYGSKEDYEPSVTSSPVKEECICPFCGGATCKFECPKCQPSVQDSHDESSTEAGGTDGNLGSVSKWEERFDALWKLSKASGKHNPELYKSFIKVELSHYKKQLREKLQGVQGQRAEGGTYAAGLINGTFETIADILKLLED